MTIAAKILKKIEGAKPGETFGYAELGIEPEEYPAAAKALERLRKKELINRATTGLFYKPLKTAFGTLKPDEQELLRPYLYTDGIRVSYVTGLSLYNGMGLTTQVPKNIKLASRDKRINVQIGNIKLTSVKSYADITEENYTILEILDVLKDFTTIPDLETKAALQLIQSRILNIKSSELVSLSLKYPPRVRAIIGALLENLFPQMNLTALRKSINPLSSFTFGIHSKQLRTVTKWNIT
jgi:hypothetical protein